MKELALLMFFVGCGYALAKLIERFSPADGRRIFFAIPSQASFNVLWGFVFYLGFAALVIHHHHWLRLLFALTAVCLLGIILYRRELFRSVSAPEGRKFTGRLEKALLRQQQEDRRGRPQGGHIKMISKEPEHIFQHAADQRFQKKYQHKG